MILELVGGPDDGLRWQLGPDSYQPDLPVPQLIAQQRTVHARRPNVYEYAARRDADGRYVRTTDGAVLFDLVQADP